MASDPKIVRLQLLGMAIYDVMCGYRVCENALENGVGEKLSLWQSAFWS